jgi:hypothetical protein
MLVTISPGHSVSELHATAYFEGVLLELIMRERLLPITLSSRSKAQRAGQLKRMSSLSFHLFDIIFSI